MSEFGWPQWVMISLWGVKLVCTAYFHGEPRKEEWDFNSAVASTFIFAWLLWMGGFFG